MRPIHRLLAPSLLALALSGLVSLRATAQDGGARDSVRTVRIPPLVRPWRWTPLGLQDTLGLRVTLEEGTAGAPAPEPTAGSGREMTVVEAARLFARLRPLPTDTADPEPFTVPPRHRPPPRAGHPMLASFPAPGSAPRPGATAAGALEITRRVPEGETAAEAGSGVTIGFSRPMVPLAAVSALAAREITARLTPRVAGRWRWLDARTLRFEPTERLPMATVFTVTVPAGTRAAGGTPLDQEVRWSFATPALRAVGGWPGAESATLRPVVVLRFDQAVNGRSLLPWLRMTAGGDTVALRLATPAELEADTAAARIARESGEGRWIAVVPTASLRADLSVRLSVEPGAPSAEGPRRTEVRQVLELRTRDVFRIVSRRCWDGGPPCRAGMGGFSFQLSNPVDPTSWSDSLVRVEPATPGLRVSQYGAGISIQGTTEARTRYRVFVSPRLRDVFGQTLGETPPQEFEVGDPIPAVWSVAARTVVLDPAGPPRLPLFSTGTARIRVRIYRADPSRWADFTAWHAPRRSAVDTEPPFPLVSDGFVYPTAEAWQVSPVRVDLAPVLRGGVGHVVVVAEPADSVPPELSREPLRLWVQATRIGLTALADGQRLTAWATSLADGRPLPGVRVSLGPVGGAGVTGRGGAATLTGLPGSSAEEAFLLARAGDDAAILPEREPGPGWATWRASPRGAVWFAFTDRNLYRPGEEVRFKGWVRRRAPGPDGRLELATRPGDSLRFVAGDGQEGEGVQGWARATGAGGFEGSFVIPADARLGPGTIGITLPGGGPGEKHSLGFLVAEFRRPEYTVSAEADPGPHWVGGSAQVTARAAYYAGGGLPGSPVEWRVTTTPGSFSPPNRDGWSFGPEREWWAPQSSGTTLQGMTDASGRHVLRIGLAGMLRPGPSFVTALATVADANGQAGTAQTTLLVHPASVYAGLRASRRWYRAGDTLAVEVIATGLDGAAVAGRPVEVTATRSEWTVSGGRWERREHAPRTCVVVSAAEPVRCAFSTSEGGVYRISARITDEEGRPSLTQTTLWVAGGAWAAPPTPGSGLPSTGEGSTVTLLPDRDRYQPGDTAEILVRSPLFPARGMVAVRREGWGRTEPLRVDGPTATIRVPISEDDVPATVVRVELHGVEGPRSGTRPTERAAGEVRLSVPPRAQTLQLSATVRDTVLEPGRQTEVRVEVRDARGNPVSGAEVAVVVVDEAVLALTGYQIPDPVSVFFQRRSLERSTSLYPLVLAAPHSLPPERGALVGTVVRNGMPVPRMVLRLEGTGHAAVADGYGRFRLAPVAPGSYVLTAAPEGSPPFLRREVRVGTGPTPALSLELPPDASGAEQLELRWRDRSGGVPQALRLRSAASSVAAALPEAAIAVRDDFRALALFQPGILTGPDGTATVPLVLPGSLTRYRVTAVAASGTTRYGKSEAAVTARRRLAVRPSPPRFLNTGDRFELPVTVQNLGDEPQVVEVAARAAGLLLDGVPGRRVEVPAGGRVEVRIGGQATVPGSARVQVVAAGGEQADAAEVVIPVKAPASAESFATYGSLADGAPVLLPVQAPRDALPGYGGLEVTTSSTQLHELTEAVLYLARNPYDGAEQISSRMLAVAGLRGVLSAFGAGELPPPEKLAASVSEDVRALAARQNPDGGFGWQGERSSLFTTAHAAHALARAERAGYPVPRETAERALRYLRNAGPRIRDGYPEPVWLSVRSYALYARAQGGDSTARAEAAALVRETGVDRLPPEPAAWLLSVLAGGGRYPEQVAALRRRLEAAAQETAGMAVFATGGGEGAFLFLPSRDRTGAVVLDALLASGPPGELAEKTAHGLLAHRVRGRWRTTQENAWTLLALGRYFQAFEEETPAFTARAWLGDQLAGEHDFRGRAAERQQVEIPMRALRAAGDTTTLALAREGTGRMYWRAALRYALPGTSPAPASEGMAVDRTYEAVDDSADVRREADGSWRVRTGARVRVRVTLSLPAERHHVALVDPLPAGFEPLNPGLRGTGPVPAGPRGDDAWTVWERWWGRRWYDHQELRDDRAAAFAAEVRAGTHTYSYLARATTPGTFTAAPPRAEEMYNPETFARGASDRVVVEAPPSRPTRAPQSAR